MMILLILTIIVMILGAMCLVNLESPSTDYLGRKTPAPTVQP